MGHEYWSCSKFADWVRGTPKPYAATTDEWNAWHKAAKVKRFRYWLAEDGLDYLEDFIFWPRNRINDLLHYFDNRWITKTHAMTSTLKRGQWYEFETRLLHSSFDELVNHVEIDQACMHVACSEEEKYKKYTTRWYRAMHRMGLWRNAEAGLEYLAWAAGLKNDEYVDENDPSFGQPTQQALAAQETIALYRWWKEERPKRPDPMDASGWSEYCDEKQKAAEARGGDSWIGSDMHESEESYDKSRKFHDAYRKIEQEQEDEDTAMLIRLVKARGSLWT